MSARTARIRAPYKRTPMFAVAQDCDTLAKMQQWKAAGGTHVGVQLGWDTAQPTAGASVPAPDAAAVRAKFALAATAGLRVIFEAAPQYPPTWVLTGVPMFKDQFGATWAGATGPSGEQVRDWVWSEFGRAALVDFYTKAFAVLGPTELALLDTIRVGWGYFGENSFPPNGNAYPQSWWGFSTPAQTGTGLAADQLVCPLPGYTPFATAPPGTLATANDLTFVAWFKAATVVRTRSLVNAYRAAGWNGNIHVLHPSFGLRSNWPTSDDRYRDQNSLGTDWGAQMDSYMQVDNTWAWCTWMSRADTANPIVNDDDKCPTRKMAELAIARGRASYVWGEPTEGATNSDLNGMFASNGPMMSAGGSGCFWLNWTSLTTGSNTTLAQLTAKIAAYVVPYPYP